MNQYVTVLGIALWWVAQSPRLNASGSGLAVLLYMICVGFLVGFAISCLGWDEVLMINYIWLYSSGVKCKRLPYRALDPSVLFLASLDSSVLYHDIT